MQEISLYDLIKFYAKRWWIILAVTALGAGVGLIYTNVVQEPLYKSTATVLVTEKTSQDPTITKNFAELFRSRLILEPVLESAGYDGTYEEFLPNVTAVNEKSTDLISLSVTTNDPKMSKTILNSAIGVFKNEAGGVYKSGNIRTVDLANEPRSPYNVDTNMQVGLAAAAGFFLAVIVLFFVFDYRNNHATKFSDLAGDDTSDDGLDLPSELLVSDSPARRSMPTEPKIEKRPLGGSKKGKRA